MSRRALDVVLFDVGGTILRVSPSVGEVYARAARDHGFEIDSEAVNQGFRIAWRRSFERSQARGYRTSDAILRAEWFEIVRDTFGESIPAASIRPLFEDIYDRFVSPGPWELVVGVRETLEYLRGEGVRLGVLSNWDSRLEPMLEELRLRSAFDFVVVSHSIEYEKPHPEIFAHAIRRSGAAPDRTLHVGDSYLADINPARCAGFQTLWVASKEERLKEGYVGFGFESFPAKPLPFWRQILYEGLQTLLPPRAAQDSTG